MLLLQTYKFLLKHRLNVIVANIYVLVKHLCYYSKHTWYLGVYMRPKSGTYMAYIRTYMAYIWSMYGRYVWLILGIYRAHIRLIYYMEHV